MARTGYAYGTKEGVEEDEDNGECRANSGFPAYVQVLP